MKKSISLLYEYSSKYKPRYRLHEMRNWTLKGSKMNYPKAYIPPEVKKVLVEEPEEMMTSTRYDDEIKRNTIIDYDVFLNWEKPNLKKLLIESDPIKEIEREESFIFSQKDRFEFGHLQATLLTKTMVMDSDIPILPNVELPTDVKQILERFILKANWWITDENKFPRRFMPRSHVYKSKTEFGIQPNDTIRYMFNDLFQYSDYLTSSNDMRMFNKDHFIETYYYWKDSRIQFSQNRDFLISGSQPLISFDKELIKWSPQIYDSILGPVDPRIDLKKSKYYSVHSCDGWKSLDVKYKYPHIITVNLDLPNIHTDFLEPEARQITQSEKNAIGIMNCFAQGVATARRIFGDEAVDKCQYKLPHPICIQAICFDSVQFDFIYYQLNTTDFSTNDIANLVWVDNGNSFFKKLYRSASMLRNTRYENLDIEVFRKFLSFYRYGCI